MTLAEKLHAIQKLARKVPKKGYNEREDFYYVRIVDVIDVSTREMRKHNLLLTPHVFNLTRTMNERGGGSIVDIEVSWTLEDLESHEIDRKSVV